MNGAKDTFSVQVEVGNVFQWVAPTQKIAQSNY